LLRIALLRSGVLVDFRVAASQMFSRVDHAGER
jgi:hypothetical protein